MRTREDGARIEIRLTQAERAALARNAAVYGLTISEYVRALCCDDEPAEESTA